MPKMARKAHQGAFDRIGQAAAAADLEHVKYDAFLAMTERSRIRDHQGRAGTVVLLRVINGSSMSNLSSRSGRLKAS